MFKLNRKLEYALFALKYMSKKAPGQLTSAKEICQTYQLPFDPTSRVLQIMTQNEILLAEQGMRGGYQIRKDLSKVSLHDLNTIIIGPIQITTCIHPQSCDCDITKACDMNKSMSRLNDKVCDLFKTIRLDEFLELTQARNGSQ